LLPPTRILVADMPRLQRETIAEVLRVRRDVEVVSAGRRQGPTTEGAANAARRS